MLKKNIYLEKKYETNNLPRLNEARTGKKLFRKNVKTKTEICFPYYYFLQLIQYLFLKECWNCLTKIGKMRNSLFKPQDFFLDRTET